MRKQAFTLIELIVVIAIIAILAAILFPVFAQAKSAAKKTQDLSNMRQIGTMFLLYSTDYDDRFPLTSFPGIGNQWPLRCQPYIKNWQMFRSPADASGRFAPEGTPFPSPEAPANDSRWSFRWTSYLLNAYMSGSFGGSGTYSTTSSLNAPANVIYISLAADDVRPRDHFHPFYWGSPSELASGFMQNLTWNPAQNETRELKLRAFTDGKNFTYADGHAKFGKWSQVWWQRADLGIFAGDFDPRNEGRR
ncbi:MAG: prepilin-type N-terminal cleavage/methylation domain-containing protein [Fimbriimonadaceae bacterium]|nr:prepilin-type N-terminal cleavage/methylation domain-containing protein [Fimbriimonadaceae bacterium]